MPCCILCCLPGSRTVLKRFRRVSAILVCSTAKRKKRGKYILWLRKSQENFLVQWLIHILKTVHLQHKKRMPRSELTRHAKGIPFVNENVYEENTLFCQKRSFDFLGIGHLHKEVTWPMLPLNNELESCWCQKLTELIKIILPLIWKETHLREIFYGTLIFQQSSMICIGRHVGGLTLALQHGGQNYFLFISY